VLGLAATNGAFAGTALAAPRTGGAHARSDLPEPVPAAVVTWFERHGAQQVLEDADGMFPWLKVRGPDKNSDTLAVGSPAREFVIDVPGYDLDADRVKGSASVRANVQPTHEYCVRVFVGGRPRDALLCVDQRKSGKVSFGSLGDQDFLPTVDDLPRSGFADVPDLGLLGIDEVRDEVVALSESAVEHLPATTVSGPELFTAGARHNAQVRALARIEGPQRADHLDPFESDPTVLAETEAKVARALALPEDLAWHEGDDMDEVLARRTAAGYDEDGEKLPASASPSQAPAVSSDAAASRRSATSTPAAAEASSATEPSRATVVLLGTLAVVLVLAAAAVLLARRRRQGRDATDQTID
jgi:hypothetical protein